MWAHRADERRSPSICGWRWQKAPQNWDNAAVEEAAQQMGFEEVHIRGEGRDGFCDSWTFLNAKTHLNRVNLRRPNPRVAALQLNFLQERTCAAEARNAVPRNFSNQSVEFVWLLPTQTSPKAQVGKDGTMRCALTRLVPVKVQMFGVGEVADEKRRTKEGDKQTKMTQGQQS